MRLRTFILSTLSSVCLLSACLEADNQTATVSPIFPGAQLPFRVVVEQAGFVLPTGIQSGAFGVYKNKWVFIAGRTNGLHNFNPGNNNFPPNEQNTTIYVVDPIAKKVFERSITENGSGLTQKQIDELSVTSPGFFQQDKTLYISGGYGITTATGNFSTKDALTALDLDGVINWVVSPSSEETLSSHMRQLHHPVFKITGGVLKRVNSDLWLLFFGQNFKSFYTPESSGVYSRQVRRFKISDNGKRLKVTLKESKPEEKDPNYRRRDLNVIPVVREALGLPVQAFVAFSGVFTQSGGAWTVPVTIDNWGTPSMPDPLDSDTFKQGMNNYVCPVLGFFSEEFKSMYSVLFGGISFGFFENGVFQTDNGFPFINQITTIELDKEGNFKQYLMDAAYPTIVSTQSNPGNQLLFGAGAFFIPASDLPQYSNGVLKFDEFKEHKFLVGYIVGGIQSTLPNTSSSSDSAASPYVFKVFLKTEK